jgi:hypothetical protein
MIKPISPSRNKPGSPNGNFVGGFTRLSKLTLGGGSRLGFAGFASVENGVGRGFAGNSVGANNWMADSGGFNWAVRESSARVNAKGSKKMHAARARRRTAWDSAKRIVSPQ